ncbi:MAG: hypothetical protein HZB41_09870 [Ignavibacteriae bacterium]|nr:hypothetical protein [Ignavibacteriota bacterium]
MGENLQLKFEKGTYGPYSHNLHHFLTFLNGYYLNFNPENNQPSTLIELVENNILDVKNYIESNISESQKVRLYNTIDLIDGFQTPFSLEILATVDYILQNNKNYSPDDILNNIKNWTKRKRQLMKLYHIEVAYKRLMEFNSLLTTNTY